MSAYLIADIVAIHDETGYADYRSRVSGGIENAGGRYLARGGPIDVLEGRWQPGRLVVVRFDSAAAARAWWASAEYEHLKRLRQAATTTNMIIVGGLPDEGEA